MSQPARSKPTPAEAEPTHEPAESPAASVVFQELLAASGNGQSPLGLAPASPWLGECVDDRHPVFAGRVRVRQLGGTVAVTREATRQEGPERWLPVLQGQAVRKGDRVLVLPLAGDEHVVVGVLDGLRRRERPVVDGGPLIELRAGEAVTVTRDNGVKLLEIVEGLEGPVVRLLHADTRIELPGKLELRAAEIELVAQRGSVRLEASDDVVVVGETVHLN